MNKFKKYCPNVWIAECEEEYEKGEVINLETKYGKEVECLVYNLILQKNEKWFYSITRIEEETYAERKSRKYNNIANNNYIKSNNKYKESQEAREFLSLGEPIKVGHHSEKRHRALFERNRKRMDKSMELLEKAEQAKHKAEYWKNKKNDINLSMPESIEYFSYKLEKAMEYHQGIKNGSIPKEHSYSLSYASKDVRELKDKVKKAEILWGNAK